ncbi:MAG: FAD-binding domain-containing protein, partial [Bacteroidota bacterium]
PELQELPTEVIHHPDTLTDQEQSRHGVKLGVDYPVPLVPSDKWRKKKGNHRQNRRRRRR